MLLLRRAAQTAVRTNHHRSFSASQTHLNERKGLVLGVFEKEGEEGSLHLTQAAAGFDQTLSGKLSELLKISGPTLKKGKSRIFYGIHKVTMSTSNKKNKKNMSLYNIRVIKSSLCLHQDFPCVAVVGLGKKDAGVCGAENWDTSKESIRQAVSAGCRLLQDLEVNHVEVDACGDAQSAAEGAALGLFHYDQLKSKKKTKVTTQLHGSADSVGWEKGLAYAEGQNLARFLMEAPANHITPTAFANTIEEKLAPHAKRVTINKRPQSWIEEQQMGAFLSVSKGSEEPPVFLELHYNGSPDSKQAPLVFVGKGVTFDSGGISLKPSPSMDAMRADMGGAATVCASIVTAAALKLPVNIIGLAPLCENMPSGKATKPGDVVTAKNGKTIQVDNTDAEGRLILADALCYGHTFNPRAIVNVATLTGAMDVALGSAAAGVFTNSDWLWEQLHKHYTRQVTDSQLADLNNIGKYSRSGGACTAAAFLREFVTAAHWAHLDIAGVMGNKDEIPYLRKGMSGRPTRTLVEFAAGLA
ncbi:Cytosol aminopeptidase [Nibea albiflora]|uniref:Cytosol aminopeptidase n=1 Tax=Nibea albiflora TaxID=240163 RepID=A0ACB7FKH6_NIBAL|nr:Cytosol aminopeptidase [Nibea albiflora]